MRMSLYAIEKVMRYSEEARDQLIRNLEWVKGSVIGETSQLKETAADQCLKELELFDTYVKNLAADLEHINELMRTHKKFIEEMNSQGGF